MSRDSSDDLYAMLGVDVTVDEVELRRAWRALALRSHPDHAGAGATATFQKLLAAYTVLSDRAARATYDRLRSGGARRRAPGVMLSRLSGPLNSLLACGVARRAERDVIELVLNEQEVAVGGMASIAMRVPVHCPACAAEPTSACERCGSTRTVDELFSAWLAIPPGVVDGDVLHPTVLLRAMVRPVWFRVRVRSAG